MGSSDIPDHDKYRVSGSPVPGATEPDIKLTLKEPTRVGNVFFLEALDSNDLTGIDHMAYRLYAKKE